MIRKNPNADPVRKMGWTATREAMLYYETCGAGTPLVLLHGNGQSHHVFDEMVPRLAKSYFLILPDSRAHGHSKSHRGKVRLFSVADMADDLAQLLDALDIERVLLLGFSDGANVALTFASRYPHRTLALAAVSGNALPAGLKPGFRVASKGLFFIAGRIKKILAPLSGWRKAYGYWRRLEQQLSLMVHSPALTAEDLAQITAPVLLMAGSRDVIRADHERWMQAQIPDATLVIMEDATHGQFFQTPAHYLWIIQHFFENHDARNNNAAIKN
ncbi:MAG: alpha/beta hydrolase [Peptococcaceae bacterium]|nr:alpha/beta hydrolase [Peptococcaceae bacterium]